jgi:hypothetical protein
VEVLIYVLIMNEVSARRIHLRKGTGGQIYKCIRDNHANQQASKLAALVSYLKSMEGLKTGKYEQACRPGNWKSSTNWLDTCTQDAGRSPVEYRISAHRGTPGTRTSHQAAVPFVAAYQANHQTVAAAQRFQIHPMFWAYLGNQAPAADRAPRS